MKKFHEVKFSHYGPSAKITRGENMEEYGRDWCIRGYTMMAAWSKQLDYTARRGSWGCLGHA